ncbi:MAG: 3-phosphoshikimate 1-carboxyvinyltransferase, partial [Candidatus Margulisiibacteriota bacterium]
MVTLIVQGGTAEMARHTIDVPADKSISHRAMILSALCEGTTRIHHYLLAEDTLNTMKIFQKLGVSIERKEDTITVKGVGLSGLRKPESTLDVGNSGTAMRLILGVLAGQPFEAVITGDASIQIRPMKRVVAPLTAMGAEFYVRNHLNEWVHAEDLDQIRAPLKVVGRRPLMAIDHEMPVSSAQIKSSILLATLYANGATSIRDPGHSRDHTEKMLRQFGALVDTTVSQCVTLSAPVRLKSPGTVTIPSDISSASFWMVLGCILPKAEITLKRVGLNPTRTGIIKVLRMMNAAITVRNESQSEGELIGDVLVKTSDLKGIDIDNSVLDMATLIDEIPVISVAATFARGKTRIRDAGELRVKESDRIRAISRMLTSFGVQVEEMPDGFDVTGGVVLSPGEID